MPQTQQYQLSIPSSKAELQELRKHANAIIIDAKSKKRCLRQLPDEYVPDDSFQHKVKGKPFYFLEYKLNKTFRTITPHTKLEENHSPLDLWTAKHCAHEVRDTYGLSSSIGQKIKIGVFIVLIIAIVFVTFMIVTAASGGAVA